MRDPHLDKLIQDVKTKQFREGEAKGLTQTIGEEIKKQLAPMFEGLAKDLTKEVSTALKALKIDIPKSDAPQVNVNVPDVHVPPFNIPTPQVTVNVPKQDPPHVTVSPTDVQFPDSMAIHGFDNKNPLPVKMVDDKGKLLQFPISMGGGGGKTDFFTILGIQNTISAVNSDPNGVAYSTANPLPVTGSFSSTPFATYYASDAVGSVNIIQVGGNTVVVGAGYQDNALRVVHATDAVVSVNIVSGSSSGATGQGDAASATRIVVAGNSDMSVVVNSGTITAVTSITNSVQTALIDSSGVQYSGSNPLPVTFSAASSQNVNIFDAQQSIITSHIDPTGDYRGLDTTNLRTINFESILNSSTTNLGIGGVFTALAEDIKDYSVVQVNVFADQSSATDGLSVQQSSNGTNWDITDTYTIPASTGKTFSFQAAARYFRIVYTNGGTGQGAFRLQTIHHQTVSKNSSQRPSDGLSNENDFEQVSAYLSALNGSGSWDRLHTGGFDSLGALRTSQATDSVSSVVVNSGTITSLTSITNTIATALVDSSGVQYSGSNPIVVDANDALGQGDLATAIRTVQAGDSVSSVVVNSGTVTAVTSITNSVQVVNLDRDGNPWSPYVFNQGDVLTALRVVQAGNVASSVMSAATGVNETTADVLRVITMSDTVSSVQGKLITRTTNPTAATDGATVFQTADKLGRAISRPIQIRELIATAYIALANGTETTLAAAVAGAFLDCIMITATNNSTAATQLDIRATTGGNIIHTMLLPASTGPIGWSPSVPWPQDNQGNNWTIDMPDQTGTTVYVSGLFSKEI